MPALATPETTVERVAKRLAASWSQVVAGAPWKGEFPLSPKELTGRALEAVWAETHRTKMRWDEWTAGAGAGVERADREAGYRGSAQPLPARLRVSFDAAARLAGEEWVARLARSRARLAILRERFPDLADVAALLRLTDAYGDVDFDLACRAAEWFVAHPRSGLTARQVPVEGIGTKWLAGRGGVVRRLAGLDDLGLTSGRPPRVHLTYLDPGHLAAGGRRYDVATLGDVDAIAYRPLVVLISENRDTAQQFGPVPGGIAVEGDGNGPGAVPALPWLGEAEHVWYWGDMDAKGLEILHQYRAAGVAARSLFMDMASYARWERFGIDHDHDGRPLGPRPPRVLDTLSSGERELYLALCSPGWTRPRRVEQERIPLDEAAAVVRGQAGEQQT